MSRTPRRYGPPGRAVAQGSGIRRWVGVVHRPRCDGGHCRGQTRRRRTLAGAAVVDRRGDRSRCRLGRWLQTSTTGFRHGGAKQVRFWSACALSGSFEPAGSVAWVVPGHPPRANGSATGSIGGALDEFAGSPPICAVWCATARAGTRSGFTGIGSALSTRPAVSRQGDSAAADGIRGPGAAPLDRLRCERTLAPLPGRLEPASRRSRRCREKATRGPDCRVGPYHRDRRRAPRSMRYAVRARWFAAARQWSRRSGIGLPESGNRKGSVWVLTLDGRNRGVGRLA